MFIPLFYENIYKKQVTAIRSLRLFEKQLALIDIICQNFLIIFGKQYIYIV